MSIHSLLSTKEEKTRIWDFQEQWQLFAEESNAADPFCDGPLWQIGAWESFTAERQLYVRSEANNLLVLSVFSEDDKVFFLPLDEMWEYGTTLFGDQRVELLYDTLTRFSEQSPDASYPRLALSGIRPGSRFAREILDTFEKTHSFYIGSVKGMARASLEDGVDGYLSRRSGNCRSKLKKARRKAEAAGVSFERCLPLTITDARDCFKRMCLIEDTSWKGIGHCGMTEKASKRFYETMMHRLAQRGEARVIFARAQEQDIGFIFGGLIDKAYRGQQFSYTVDWKPYSIGNILQIEQIEWLCEEGIMFYDMGGGTEPGMEYKRHWTEQLREIHTWVLVPKKN